MFRTRFFLLIGLVLSLIVTPVMHAVDVKNLPPVYRHWLTEEVPYIIESQERKEFLALTTDAERDAFIQNFWEVRNPTPGSEINTYKEEHYRRIAYAEANFQGGWRGDQGMVYITLGAPQSKVTYPNSRNVRPIIIWFYQSPSPALPSFFSVMFYKRSTGEPYTLYSPYQDGPNRLVTGLEALNDQLRSLKQIREALGDEVARTALTLSPTEPVNLNDYSPSMMSDGILSTIRGLADSAPEVARINRNRQREKVTASIFSTDNTPDIGYSVMHDDQGHSTVDLLLHFPQPDSQIVGNRKAGGVGYDLTLQNRIATAGGKPVYETVSTLTGRLQPAQADAAKKRIFGAEDQLPLEPGKYKIETTLTNNITLAAHRLTTLVTVPMPVKGLSISQPVAYTGSPSQVSGPRLPFTYAGVRFTPQGVGTVSLHAGESLHTVFQIWLPKDGSGVVNKNPIAMHYYLVSPAVGAKPQDEADENVDTANADTAGNLVSGHSFSTDGLAPGSYRVVIKAQQGATAPAFGTLNLRIVPAEFTTQGWSAYGPPEPQQDETKRSLSAKAVTGAPASTK